VVHIPKWLALIGTGTIEIMLRSKKTPNRYSTGAVVSWNLRLPVAPNTLADIVGIQPKYPTIAEGIPEVLDECVAYSWVPSNIDE
jgi:hypothetical protein